MVFEDGGGEIQGTQAVFYISDKRKLVVVFPDGSEKLRMKYTDLLDSPLDDQTTIKIIWEIECEMISTDGPPEHYIEESLEHPMKENRKPDEGKQLVDKNGKRIQCCRGCKRPRKGHRGKMGPACTAAKSV